MALTVRVAAQAKRDTGRILSYIAMDNLDAARKLANALESGLLRLQDFPLSGPRAPNRVHPDIRQLIVPPCRILYRVEADTLLVVGVMRCEQALPAAEGP